jgi:hypothetical protein
MDDIPSEYEVKFNTLKIWEINKEKRCVKMGPCSNTQKFVLLYESVTGEFSTDKLCEKHLAEAIEWITKANASGKQFITVSYEDD